MIIIITLFKHGILIRTIYKNLTLWPSKVDKIMNMHTNESNVHKQCEFAQMYYQALAKKSSTKKQNVEPRERNMKPQKQLQLSHAHNSRSAHTNKSNWSAGGVQRISMLIYSVLHNHTDYKRGGGGGEDISVVTISLRWKTIYGVPFECRIIAMSKAPSTGWLSLKIRKKF